MLYFELDMAPISWSAPRLSRGQTYNPKSKEKKHTIQELKWLMPAIDGLIKGYVVLDLEFIFQLPKTASKRQKQKMIDQEVYPTQKDCTNMQKFIEDCLKNVAFEDDRYVVNVRSKKRYGQVEKGKILINVYSIEEYKEIQGTCA
jgi:Holliday junction resolvase RusA-like endonuclease